MRATDIYVRHNTDSGVDFSRSPSRHRSHPSTQTLRDIAKHKGALAPEVLAFQIYRRLAETQPQLIPDPRFFNAALRVFLRANPVLDKDTRNRDADQEVAQLRRCLAGEASQTSSTNLINGSAVHVVSLVMRDLVNAGYPIPLALQHRVRPAEQGVFEYSADALRVNRTASMRKRPALVDWQTPRRFTEGNMLRSLPTARDRGSHKRRRTVKHAARREVAGRCS